METVTLGLFSLILITCLIFGLPTLYALFAGLILFSGYALKKGNPPKKILSMLISGILTAKNILIVFVLIGMMTALWRACGTIPFIICHAAKLLRPEVILLVSFLLNCALSVLTGTSFGTAATIGVICMAMGVSAGASPLLLGGAILSGAFFGDRCSPFSTSALLVSELTKTSIFDNIKNMVRTAWFPFLLTCILYGVLGFQLHSQTETTDLTSLFGREVVLHPAAILPAVVILILALMRIPVKFAMLASIAASLVVGFFIQDLAVTDLPQLLLSGYHAADPEAATFLDGGGILSMVKVAAIVCILILCRYFPEYQTLRWTESRVIEAWSAYHPVRCDSGGSSRHLHDCLQPDTLHYADNAAWPRSGARQCLHGTRPGKLCRDRGPAHPVVHRRCCSPRNHRSSDDQPVCGILSVSGAAVLSFQRRQ